MGKRRTPIVLRRDARGFTLLEVMVSLVIGTIIVGGVMGLISTSLNYQKRINDRSMVEPILDAAAQAIIADPTLIEQGHLSVPGFAKGPGVDVVAAQVEFPDSGGAKVLGETGSQLYRVQLNCLGQTLEFSVLVPRESKFQ